MPDKHEVGGSTPLEPTKLRKQRGARGQEEDSEGLIQRISSYSGERLDST